MTAKTNLSFTRHYLDFMNLAETLFLSVRIEFLIKIYIPQAFALVMNFLKYLVSRFFIDGEFMLVQKEASASTKPHIYSEPKLILSPKSQGYAEALEKLVEAITDMNDLPEALLRIIGIRFWSSTWRR